jgi:YidC/Oxa1 family membrane protein insertase
MSYIFHLFFYNPLYNGLILLLGTLPIADVGIAVILFTALVKLILFPLSAQSVKTQMKMKQVQPALDVLKEKYKDNKEKQAQELMNFYKVNGINPFSGVLLLFIQIPIIFALYFIFLKGGLPNINTAILYEFVKNHIPSGVNMEFLGLFDISKPQVVLAIIAGISQFAQVQFSVPAVKKVDNPSFKDDMARSMNVQMRYILPLFIFIIALKVSGAVALYWITSNLFIIGQELYMRQTIKKPTAAVSKE